MKKRVGQAAAFAVGGLALLGVAAACWGSSKAGAVFAALFGFGLIAFAAFGCYESPCPDCGKAVSMDGAAELVRCPHCRRYARPTGAGLAALQRDFVADAPVFAIPFSEGMALPDGCCVCRKASTRHTTIGAKMEDTRPAESLGAGLKKNALLGAGVGTMIEVRVDVPHCDEHQADARVYIEQGAGSLVEPEDARLVIGVRSYPYYRSALGLN